MKPGQFSCRSCRRGGQRGFSLLELLLVLGLMATAAVLALSSVSNRDNQNRFEETRNKLATIRKAIVGEPQILNGQQNVNGFVADMGRLPLNLEELLVEPVDCDGDDTLDSDGNSDPAIDVCNWQFDADTELWHGWHGPYINSISAHYRDGWGNPPDENGLTTSLFDDAPENHGWYWEPLTANGLLLVSNGLDRAFVFDASGKDTDNRLSGSSDQAYADSRLQRLQLAQQHTHSTLPHNPLHLTVQPAPYCGQCRTTQYLTDTACTAAGFYWDASRLYCVDTSITISDVSSCETVSHRQWLGVYGVGGSSTSCPTPTFEFVNTTTSQHFCARPIHIEHGLITLNSHKTSDTTYGTIGASALPNTITQSDDVSKAPENYQPAMETNAATPVAGLTLPQGQLRFGLFKFEASQTPQCTDKPYPSESAQAVSDIITLSSQYPPAIGTSTHPIHLKWRSQ